MKRFLVPVALGATLFVITFALGRAQQCPQGFTLTGGKCVAQTSGLPSNANIAIGPGNPPISGTVYIKDNTPTTGATTVTIARGAAQTTQSQATLVDDWNTALTWQNVVPENGANNAIAGTLTGLNLQQGTCVTIGLAHTLQAGANTFALNGGAALPIYGHFNSAAGIAKGYASGGYIQLCYAGSIWFDMSQ